MGIDTVKEANQTKFQSSHREQDHGTRGTNNRDRSTVRILAETKARQREKEEEALVDEYFVDQPELANQSQNIEIKRNIRRRIKEMVKGSVDQWRGIWGDDEFVIETLRFPTDLAFQRCIKEENSIFLSYRFGTQEIRIRPSELKLYKQLLRKYPEKDRQGNPLNSLSHLGERILIQQLAALGRNQSGVTPLALERSFIARQVRQEMKNTSPKPKQIPALYEEDPDFFDDTNVEEASVGWRPPTEEEREEERRAKKEKYFGSR